MKIEITSAERNALLDEAGRDNAEAVVLAFIAHAKSLGFSHFQTIALVDYLRILLETAPAFAGFGHRGEGEKP